MKIYLAFETDVPVKRDIALHGKLRDTLLDYHATVIGRDDDLEGVDGVVAELSYQSPELLASVERGLQLGKPTLLLARAAGMLAIPEALRGRSVIRPDGVRYSQDYVAVSALRLFIDMQFRTFPPGAADRLEHPISQEPEIIALRLDDQGLLELGQED